MKTTYQIAQVRTPSMVFYNCIEKVELPADYGNDSEEEAYKQNQEKEAARQESECIPSITFIITVYILIIILELLAQEREESTKKEEIKTEALLQEQKDDEKCDPEDPEQRTIFISGLSKKLKQQDIAQL